LPHSKGRYCEADSKGELLANDAQHWRRRQFRTSLDAIKISAAPPGGKVGSALMTTVAENQALRPPILVD
jgi:hypothetical protein